jgi:hypothetical protein
MIDVFRISRAYPDFTGDDVTTPSASLEAVFAQDGVWIEICDPDRYAIVRMIWSQKPTLVHPTHTAPLADEIGSLMTLTGLSAATRSELEALRTLAGEAAATGDWLITLGP